ncbi:MAG: S1C family serine protease, partial [Acidimicrobiales bacterium]
SECSDLAVIQLEGDGYQALEFRTDEVATGVDVFSAGYPATDAATIEDVDYTLTGGIISATNANGETNWASVDGVLEHDARIRGGNSGGPLVDETGRVVGVNYAGIDESDQNFAIDAAQAEAVISTLSTGEDVDSVGINGQAVADPEAGISGIWVASVESGSPADNAGIEAGDIVTKLEGLVLAVDGTMSDYCDILRTQGSEDVLAVEVLRFETGEVLEGQLNGDPLELSFSFAQEFEEEVAEDPGDAALDTYTDYVTVEDDTGTIRVDVPAEWTDTNGAENPNFGPSIWAAPDLESFNTTWDSPGVKVETAQDRGASDIGASLNEIDFSQVCTNGGRTPYQDPLYIGEAQLWTDCGGTDAIYIVVAAVPAASTFMVRVEIQAVEPRDLDAADRVLDTFVAVGA